MGTSVQTPIRRLTADEAMRMVAVGIVREDEAVELLDGLLVQMSPQAPVHTATISQLAKRLRRAYPQHDIREEKPLSAGTYSLPEPDLAVVPGADWS